ncbi:hypothetical protein WJX77_004434 [Trebouxia sp. C0004]
MNYLTVCTALSVVSGDFSDNATQTQEIITLEQAQESHKHPKSIHRQLILAAWEGYSPPKGSPNPSSLPSSPQGNLPSPSGYSPEGSASPSSPLSSPGGSPAFQKLVLAALVWTPARLSPATIPCPPCAPPPLCPPPTPPQPPTQPKQAGQQWPLLGIMPSLQPALEHQQATPRQQGSPNVNLTANIKDPADLFEDLANIEIVAMWNEAFFELHYKPTALHQRGSVGSAAE